jgi:hypothetical protein
MLSTPSGIAGLPDRTLSASDARPSQKTLAVRNDLRTLSPRCQKAFESVMEKSERRCAPCFRNKSLAQTQLTNGNELKISMQAGICRRLPFAA